MLNVGNGRPPDLPPPEITVYLDDQFIDNILVEDLVQTISLPIPTSTERETTNHTLRLEIDTWVPANHKPGPDKRELGIYLDWVRIIISE